MISCEIISYAFAWRRCGYTAHAFSFSHPSPPVAVAQYSVGWSVFHGAHTAVLGIGVFGTSSSHHPYAQPQRHQGTCATDRWGHLSTTVLEDFNCVGVYCLACVVLSAALVTRRPEGDGTSVRAKPPPNGLQHRKQPLLSPFLLCFARTVYF